MFLQNLSQKEKEASLIIIQKFIESDNEISSNETIILQQFEFETGINCSELNHSVSLEKMTKNFNSKKSKVSLLLELIGIGYADSDYSQEEKVMLREIAMLFDIKENELLKMEEWVKEMVELTQAAYSFMEE